MYHIFVLGPHFVIWDTNSNCKAEFSQSSANLRLNGWYDVDSLFVVNTHTRFYFKLVHDMYSLVYSIYGIVSWFGGAVLLVGQTWPNTPTTSRSNHSKYG